MGAGFRGQRGGWPVDLLTVHGSLRYANYVRRVNRGCTESNRSQLGHERSIYAAFA
jgi:hypothetical protein